ncbi:uncharacterized protein EV422DRAFT_568535 [Fimicolochytrium jonesii]|uniref:uncharacterized protein n=1 Tax=Fimicolochytrium jonesii TaxID=1396493 RepID=UPI0022FE856E|nr:uncharacterized protein EV422DRAFT_568535 [Fimicolochytrium jonesii]KAI8819564.1 hypothetical protein EV422DRAFT_568535 [Fimicolochytrium jonesii]
MSSGWSNNTNNGWGSSSRGHEEFNERLLERQNDDALHSLHGKISALKNVTIDMHDDVNTQNELLSKMGMNFDNAKDQLSGSMRRLKLMINTKHGKNTWTIVGVILVLCFLVWLWSKRS